MNLPFESFVIEHEAQAADQWFHYVTSDGSARASARAIKIRRKIEPRVPVKFSRTHITHNALKNFWFYYTVSSVARRNKRTSINVEARRLAILSQVLRFNMILF